MDNKKADEKVLCIHSDDVFENIQWNGINDEVVDKVLKLSVDKGEYRKRGEVEEDSSWQQIIPYIVFRNKDKIFLMQRLKEHTDQRLANFYSIGIGGHLRQEDLDEGEDVIDWAKREFDEEVAFQGDLEFKVLGVLNDNSAPVHAVHLGVVILATGDSSDISVKDEHKKGELVTISEARENYDQMEEWSKIVLDYLDK